MPSFTSQPAAAADDGDAEVTDITPGELTSFTFDLDEVEFTCRLRTDADAVLEWSEFASAALDNVDSESPEGVALIAKLLRLALPNGEYRRFRSHMRSHHTEPEVLMQVLQYINEKLEAAVSARTARPTRRPSPSSRGDSAQDARVRKVISLGSGDVAVMPLPATSDHQPKQTRKKPPARRKAASAG
jgi:hypothetical protein